MIDGMQLMIMQMTRSRVSLRGSQPGSGESEDDSSDARSPGLEEISAGQKYPQTADAMDTKA